MDDQVSPGEVVAGDIIAIPGAVQRALVRTVRLGQGGFIFMVSSADEPSSDAVRQITVTAQTRLEWFGRIPVVEKARFR
jgi:hypothetical protein